MERRAADKDYFAASLAASADWILSFAESAISTLWDKDNETAASPSVQTAVNIIMANRTVLFIFVIHLNYATCPFTRSWNACFIPTAFRHKR